MSHCINCSSLTDYICLVCKKPACNKTKDCSIPASEETTDWKAGVSVGYCFLCSKSSANDGRKKNNPVGSAKLPKHCKEGSQYSRKCLTLSQKVEVIHASKNHGESTRKLATKFECGKTQIIKILKNKDSILETWMSNGAANNKRSNNEKFAKINRMLWDWYVKVRQSNIPVDGPLLKEEARLIAEKLGETSFKGTDGWFAKWKQRYNLTQMNVAGEEGDVNQETVESWNERVKELTTGFAPADVWNQDETGTFWKSLPSKSLAEKRRRCRGGKNSKQRVTAAFFVNAAGGKESPVIIGKSKKPRCFAKLPDVSRPCGAQYFHNAKSWMKSEIMVNVLTKMNDKMRRDGRHILLFLDNAPCHPQFLKGMFSNIRIEFLPKNTTSRTQPLDAGIIKTWKVYYRRKLLRYVVSQIDDADGPKKASEIVKSVHLLMAIRWMVNAWEEVKPEVITKCFKHVGMYPDETESMLTEDDPFDGEELLELQDLLSKMSTPEQELDASSAFDDDVEAYEPSVDTSLPNWRETLRAEIVEDSEDPTETGDPGDETDDFDQPLKTPEVKNVHEAILLTNKLTEFSEWKGNEELTNLFARAKDVLVDLQLKSMSQSSIKGYFTDNT